MAWTITTWDDADWSAAATLNEFVDAVNERKLAAGLGAPFAAVNAGDDVQAATFFTAYQQWIEDNLTSFVVSHDGGVARGGGYYDGAGTVGAYANLGDIFVATDLAHTNWRRYTTHPDEGGVVAYGQMQAGDIIGPWIFEDIQKCLNVLVWTKKAVTFSGEAFTGNGVGATWAIATAASEADYALAGASSVPDAYTLGYELGGTYTAWQQRAACDGQATVWNGCTRHADWYIYPALPLAVLIFEDYGDDVIEVKWSLWSQDEPATDDTAIVSGTTLGQVQMPPTAPYTWCGAPTLGGYAGKGWEKDDSVVVLRWNVAGGFTYA